MLALFFSVMKKHSLQRIAEYIRVILLKHAI